MKTFIRKVDTRSRQAMVEYLQEHFRYDTMNSCNNSTSYAHNMKVYNLGLESEIEDRLYELLECEEFYWPINDLTDGFGKKHGYSWQAGFNGRQGGYLVLYQGGKYQNGQVYFSPGRGTDQGEDFTNWDMCALRDRVKLVQEFDRLAEDILYEAVHMAKDYKAVDEEYTVTKTRKVFKEVSA